MDFLKRLFGSGSPEPSPVDEINRQIRYFTTATFAGVDAEDIGRYPPKQRKVMAFHYGAIQYLAEQHGLDETQTLSLFVSFLDKYFNMPITETGSISERLQGFYEKEDEHRFLEAGCEIFIRWHEQGERRAPLELGEMLKRPQHE